MNHQYLLSVLTCATFFLSAQNISPVFKTGKVFSEKINNQIKNNKYKIEVYSALINDKISLLDSSATNLEDSIASLNAENDALKKSRTTSSDEVITFYGAASVVA